MQTPNKLEVKLLLIEAICQQDGASQLQHVKQGEESIGDRVSGEKTSVQHLGAEPFETGSRWTPALGDGSHRCYSNIQELAAVG
jgi:hypothetical protein